MLHLCAFVCRWEVPLVERRWQRSGTEHRGSPPAGWRVLGHVTGGTGQSFLGTFHQLVYRYWMWDLWVWLSLCRAGCRALAGVGGQQGGHWKWFLVPLLYLTLSTSEAFAQQYSDTRLYHSPLLSTHIPTQKVSYREGWNQLRFFLLPFGQEVELKSGFYALMSLMCCVYEAAAVFAFYRKYWLSAIQLYGLMSSKLQCYESRGIAVLVSCIYWNNLLFMWGS